MTVVAVAMSGGVDSSVAAALLLEKGYEVIGITMLLSEVGSSKAAAEVAEKLEIPFHVIDMRDCFEKRVVNYFLEEYVRGRTPNPCIACNRYLKFGTFIEKAVEYGADYVATGHYANVQYDEERKRYLLLRGKDEHKDQSYVLYNLTQDQLAKVIFPLGCYDKTWIKKKAQELGLTMAQGKESQEICFIPDNDYKGFIAGHVASQEMKPGVFLNIKGEVVGKHRGVPCYTVGQRKGLGLALGYPAYVVDIDVQNNTVTIGEERDIYRKGLLAGENNFIAFDELQRSRKVQAKVRYGAIAAAAEIYPQEDGMVKVLFDNPQRAITPGQAVVYYDGEMVLGGGIIERSLRF